MDIIAVQAALAKIINDATALQAFIVAPPIVPPVVPPVVPPAAPPITGVSPDGELFADQKKTLTDAHGDVYTLDPTKPFHEMGAQVFGFPIIKNGTAIPGSTVWKLAIQGGVMWAATVFNTWYKDTNHSTAWVQQAAGPWPKVPSANGVSIVPGDLSAELVDSKLNYYSFGPHNVPTDYWIMKNGNQYTQFTCVKMVMQDDRLWIQTGQGKWLSDNTQGFFVSQANPPPSMTASVPTTPPVIVPPAPVVVPPSPALDNSIPQAAIDAGMTVLNWEVTFPDLSRIDIHNANTPTASTDFWVTNAYTNTPVIPASYLSVDNGVLTILKSRDGVGYSDNAPTLQSVWWPNLGAAPGTDHGRFFKNGWYIDFDFTFDQSLASSGSGFPAFWASNFWNKQSEYMEIDFIEVFPQLWFMGVQEQNVGFGFFTNEPRSDSRYSTYPPSDGFPQPRFADFGNPKFDGTDFHRVGNLWTTMDQGAALGHGQGVGAVRRYFDGKEFTPNKLTYSLTAHPSYGSPLVGGFSLCEPQPGSPNFADYKGFGFYITCGNQHNAGDLPWPLKIRRIRIFQKSAADMVVI